MKSVLVTDFALTFLDNSLSITILAISGCVSASELIPYCTTIP